MDMRRRKGYTFDSDNEYEIREKKKEDRIIKLAKIGLVAIIGLVLFFGSVYTVSAGHRGVLLTFGKPSEIVQGEGIHFKIPIVQTVKKFEVRTQKIETVADSASNDLQDVQTTIALNFHVIPEETNVLYQTIGSSYRERIIDPAIQESVKAVTAQFTAEELITRRAEVRDGISFALSEKLLKSHIKVDDINIINFQFSEEFDRAIEAKVTAEQLKLKAIQDLERIRVEAQQQIAKAQAEAEGLRLQKQQITPDLIKLRAIEAQIKAIEKWDGTLPQITGGAIPFINIQGLSQNEETIV